MVSSGGVASASVLNFGYQDVSSGGAASSTTINGGSQSVLSGGAASNTIVNSGGSMYVSSGGILAGALTINGGHVTVEYSDNLQPSAMGFKLASAQANDALLTIESGAVGDISHTTFTLNVNNTASGAYILGSGADLTGMSSAVFTVTDNGQNVNVQVGSSYTFTDGDKLSLSLTNAATDQLRATFTVSGGVADTSPPTVPGGLSVGFDKNKDLLFKWTPSTDNVSVDHYELTLSDSAGNVISDWLSDSASSFRYTPKPGTFTWHVKAVDTSGNESAWSKVSSFTVTPTDTVGNTLATAGTLDVNGSVDEWVGLGDSADYYKLTLDNAGTLNLNLTDLSDNANLALYDAKGKLLKSSSAKGTADENINNLALLGGDYYVKVAPSDAGKGTVNTYYTLSNTVDYFPDDTVGNTLATAGTLDVNGSAEEWVGFGDPADYYKLTLDSSGKLSINMTGLSGDANMTLYDAKGKSLKSSSNKGVADENINNLVLLGGDYYVKVAPADGGKGTVNTGYTLSNTVDYFPEDTVGNTLATAGTLDANGSADEWVGFGDPADYYKLTLDTAGTLNLNLTDLSGNANLTLYDAKGKLLKSSSNKDVADENITNLALLGGDYYVKVAPADGGKGTVNNTDYTLSNTVDYFPDDTAGNTFAVALQVSESGPVSEWLGFGDKDDYYKFELQTGTTVTLNLTDMTSNVNLYLYDSKSKQLAASAKAGNAADSITKTLAAGTYYVKATLAGKDNTDYSLNFNIDPAAFKSGSLRLFGAATPLTGGADTALTGSNDPLKKNQGMLAS